MREARTRKSRYRVGKIEAGEMLATIIIGASAALRPLPQRVLCFGDSLTAGLIGDTRDSYVPYSDTLSKALDVESVPHGVVLESVHSMPARLDKVLSEQQFDCAIVLGGSNDLWRGDRDAIVLSLEALYSRVRSHGALLGVVTLPPFEPSVMRWLSFTGVLEITDTTRCAVNEAIRLESRRDDAFLVDLAAFADEEVMHRPDGLHFEAAGYARLGQRCASAIREFCS